MKYIIESLNGIVEIINPTIEVLGLSEVNPNISGQTPPNKMYKVELHLITPQSKFGLTIDVIQSETMSFTDSELLINQVEVSLDSQFGV